MEAIRIDVDWVDGYARQVEQAAAEVTKVRDDVRAHPLHPDAFGEAGRNTGIADAYQHALDLLTEQVDRAAQMLTSAATGLNTTTGHLTGHQDEGVAAFRRIRPQ